MKRIVSLVLCMIMMLTAASALAEGMGVQVLSAPAPQNVEPVDMDDIKLGKEIPIEGYGVITPRTCEWADDIYYGDYSWTSWESGNEAEYLVLTVEILNTQYEQASYLDNCEVKADFGEGYVFGGWRKQYKNSQHSQVIEYESDEFGINPLYVGKYAFIVTLPNFCKDSQEPLSITVTLTEDVVLTYHVRK